MEQDGGEGGGDGEEKAHVSAHYHPQRLQDLPNRRGTGTPDTPLSSSGSTAVAPCSWSSAYRQQSLNIFLQEGGEVLPVQDVSQPAVLPLHHHLLATWASRLGHVLENA